MNAARRERRACALATRLADGAQRFVAAADVAADPLAEPLEAALRSGKSATIEHEGEADFLTVQVPPVRLVDDRRRAYFAGAGADRRASPASTPSSSIRAPPSRRPSAFPTSPVLAQWPDEALEAAPLDRYTAIAF